MATGCRSPIRRMPHERVDRAGDLLLCRSAAGGALSAGSFCGRMAVSRVRIPADPFPFNGTPWSEADVALLRELWNERMSTREIAARLGRSFGSVGQKARIVGLRRASQLFEPKSALPTQPELLAILTYDPTTGLLCRKMPAPGSPAGAIAGTVVGEYRRVMVGRRRYPATTLIWVMMTGEWPDRFVEHRDTYGPKRDWGNRWENLRLATRVENGRNRRRNTDNRSGVPGVKLFGDKWGARITIAPGRRIFLGLFDNLANAAAARRKAEIKYFGEFAPEHHWGVNP